MQLLLRKSPAISYSRVGDGKSTSEYEVKRSPKFALHHNTTPRRIPEKEGRKTKSKIKTQGKNLKQTELIFPEKADSLSYPRARQTASPLTAHRERQFFRVPHLFSYSVGLIRQMPVSILQASIKLLNAPFHLVFLSLTVTFRAPHGSFLSHFYLPTPFPFQAHHPRPPSPAAQPLPLLEHL